MLKIPARKWDDELHGITSVYVIPSDDVHDSGYACMNFVAETDTGAVRFGGGCDVVRFNGNNFRLDCIPGTKLIHIWNRNEFSISPDISSIEFTEN